MDVLGMYLLQRVSNELTIQKNESFENRFVAPVPDSTAARVTHVPQRTYHQGSRKGRSDSDNEDCESVVRVS